MTSAAAELAGFKEGVDILYEPKTGGTVKAEIDIVAVHGLGANPNTIWNGDEKDEKSFNWLKDKDGLQADFPNARVMKFRFPSAYRGTYRIDQRLDKVAKKLLDCVQNERDGCKGKEKCTTRPLVFIGHSMGGIVIARALCIAERETRTYPGMYASFSSCVFFGTPFSGAPVADIAKEWIQLNKSKKDAIDSELIPLLQPNNPWLREIKESFIHSATKLDKRVELLCFYETLETSWDLIIEKLAKKGSMESAKKLKTDAYRRFVSEESATLDVANNVPLAKTHRLLPRFESHKDDHYTIVRINLKRLINNAKATATARFKQIRPTVIKDEDYKKILSVLEGVGPNERLRLLKQQNTTRSWITKVTQYQDWLADSEAQNDYLWVYGVPGKGKLAFATDAVEEIKSQANEPGSGSDRLRSLVVHFFCDKSQDTSTAEDLVKSLLWQLCSEEDVFATYAKHFAKDAKKTGQDSKTGSMVSHLGIENLWLCLQDMLTEGTIGMVYFVIANLHELSEKDPSTRKLLDFIQYDIANARADLTRHVKTRWLFTSRNHQWIRERLSLDPVVRQINLDDNEQFGGSLRRDLRGHAWIQAEKLRESKGYNSAITYFMGSTIGNRADNKKWVDMTVIQLEALPSTSSDAKIRRVLEHVPQAFSDLLDDVWMSVLHSNDEEIVPVKELLRSLMITYEDPTKTELMILMGFNPDSEKDIERIHQVIAKCAPLLVHDDHDETSKVAFANEDLKMHLLENSKALLGLEKEDVKLQHGILAFRCFAHVVEGVKAYLKKQENEAKRPDYKGDAVADLPKKLATPAMSVIGTSAAEEVENKDTDEEGSEDEDGSVLSEIEEEDDYLSSSSSEAEPQIPTNALRYAIIYWLRHAGEAPNDMSDRLVLGGKDNEFWCSGSPVRAQWLKEFEELTNSFDDLDVSAEGLNALHIASSLGFPQLVESLLEEGYEQELKEYDTLNNQPLHLAATFGHAENVEKLISKGAPVNDAGANGTCATPLAMAAASSRLDIMHKLINVNANINSVSDSFGPVINAAIHSGDKNAVELLINQGATLSYPLSDDDETDWFSPLTLAAYLSDSAMFSTILDAGANSLIPDEYNKAFYFACVSGRVEVVNKLLKYTIEDDAFQQSLNAAAMEENWDVISILLKEGRSLDCETLFYEACQGTEDLAELLELCQQHNDVAQEVLDECLFIATDKEKENLVRILLGFGANSDAKGELYGNALTASAYDGTTSIMKELLGAGATVNSAEGYPLIAAAEQGHIEAVQLLLDHEAEVNFQSELHPSRTALQAACDFGRTEVVRLLLEHHADVNLGGGVNSYPILGAIAQLNQELLETLLATGRVNLSVDGGPCRTRPLQHAAMRMPVQAVETILHAGADVNEQDNDGDTALIAAVIPGDYECVRVLLEHGADFLATNRLNRTALQLALENGFTECVELLANRATALLKRLNAMAQEGSEDASLLKNEELQQRTASMEAEAAAKKVREEIVQREMAEAEVENAENESVQGNEGNGEKKDSMQLDENDSAGHEESGEMNSARSENAGGSENGDHEREMNLPFRNRQQNGRAMNNSEGGRSSEDENEENKDENEADEDDQDGDDDDDQDEDDADENEEHNGTEDGDSE